MTYNSDRNLFNGAAHDTSFFFFRNHEPEHCGLHHGGDEAGRRCHQHGVPQRQGLHRRRGRQAHREYAGGLKSAYDIGRFTVMVCFSCLLLSFKDIYIFSTLFWINFEREGEREKLCP